MKQCFLFNIRNKTRVPIFTILVNVILKTLKEISPEYLFEGLMLKLKLQYCGHMMRRADSVEKTLMLGTAEGGRRRG